MSGPLRIALVSPHPSPPRDDVAWHVAAVAGALAGRGHAVTVLAPALREAELDTPARSRLVEVGYAQTDVVDAAES